MTYHLIGEQRLSGLEIAKMQGIESFSSTLADAGAFRGKVTPHDHSVVPQSPGTANITTHDLILPKIQNDQSSPPFSFSRNTNLETAYITPTK